MPFFFIFKHSRAPNRSCKNYSWGPGKSWIFVSKRVGTLVKGQNGQLVHNDIIYYSETKMKSSVQRHVHSSLNTVIIIIIVIETSVWPEFSY